MTASALPIDTAWTRRDWWGALAVRCNVGRMHYTVESGLYAVNDPGPDAPVFVSANYKLSFDHLRRALAGQPGWILVLDTRGINVWCAAGKGTFGTEELVRSIRAADLVSQVSHRNLIVPQLGAPGVAAHQVTRETGFRIVYGPVRAQDIPVFLRHGMKADADMRRVRFGILDRLAVAPVELTLGIKYALIAAAIFALPAGWRQGNWTWAAFRTEGTTAALSTLGGFLFAGIAIPALLPWLPGRAFGIKGAAGGLLAWLLLWALSIYSRPIDLIAWLLLLGSMASFVGLNFTGASTYTSLSGVKKETRWGVPVMAAGLLAGFGVWLYACKIL